MSTNKENLNIYQKLLEVQKKNITFTKDATNPDFNSKYLSLDELNKTLKPILNELGLLIVHTSRDRNIITAVVDTESGNQIESRFAIPDTITDPQKMGSAISYGKRYNIGQLFNIVTDEDDDGNSVSGAKKPIDANAVRQVVEGAKYARHQGGQENKKGYNYGETK
jgi:hypothetical protein